MLKSDLVETLTLFEEEERTRLLDFVRSPYCNPMTGNPDPLHLLETIFHIIDKKKPAALQRDRLYEQVFPGQPVVKNKLEKLFSVTLKLVRQFHRSEYFQNKFPANWSVLAESTFFQEKSAYEISARLLDKLGDAQGKAEPREYADYLLDWEIERHRQILKNEIYQKKDDQNILAALEALETFYLSQRHFYTFYLLTLQQVTPLLLDKEIDQLVVNNRYPAQSGYLLGTESRLFRSAIDIMLHDHASPDTIFKFLNDLELNSGQISNSSNNHLEVFAINYCVKHFSNVHLQSTLYNLLKRRVSSGRSFNGGKIGASEFQNIVKVGLLQKDFTWIWNFLQDNRFNVSGSQSPEAYFQFNLATYWFYNQEFERALDALSAVNFEEMQYKMSAKILEIKILWELDSDILLPRVDAAKIYFYREKKIPADKKEMCCSFCDYMRRLVRPQTAINRQRIDKMWLELQENRQVAEWFWLVEKLEQMRKVT